MIGVQRMISKYVIPPKVVERDCMYKVKVDVTGTEHCFAEALHLKGGWEQDFNVTMDMTYSRSTPRNGQDPSPLKPLEVLSLRWTIGSRWQLI